MYVNFSFGIVLVKLNCNITSARITLRPILTEKQVIDIEFGLPQPPVAFVKRLRRAVGDLRGKRKPRRPRLAAKPHSRIEQ